MATVHSVTVEAETGSEVRLERPSSAETKLLALLDNDSSFRLSISNDLCLLAQKELQEKPEWRQRDIVALREMVKAEAGLIPCLSSPFLLRFLRARKFDYDHALKLYKNYFYVRTQHSELFSKLDYDSLHSALAEGVFSVLPGVDFFGRKVLLIQPGLWDQSIFNLNDQIRCLLLILESLVIEDSVQINGLVAIIDLANFSTTTTLHLFRPTVLRKLIESLQDAFPCRCKAIHFVHEPALLQATLVLMKPMMKEKLRDRLHFHGSNTQQLNQHFDLEILPTQLGGTLTTHSPKNYIESTLATMQPYFEKLSGFGYNDISAVDSLHQPQSPVDTVLNFYRRMCIDTLNE